MSEPYKKPASESAAAGGLVFFENVERAINSLLQKVKETEASGIVTQGEGTEGEGEFSNVLGSRETYSPFQASLVDVVDGFCTEFPKRLRHEPPLLHNKFVSRALERVITVGEPRHVRALCYSLLGRFSEAMMSPAASYGIETLFAGIYRSAAAQSSDTDENDGLPDFPKLLALIVEEVLESVAALIQHRSGTKALCSLLLTLAGRPTRGVPVATAPQKFPFIAAQLAKSVCDAAILAGRCAGGDPVQLLRDDGSQKRYSAKPKRPRDQTGTASTFEEEISLSSETIGVIGACVHPTVCFPMQALAESCCCSEVAEIVVPLIAAALPMFFSFGGPLAARTIDAFILSTESVWSLTLDALVPNLNKEQKSRLSSCAMYAARDLAVTVPNAQSAKRLWETIFAPRLDDVWMVPPTRTLSGREWGVAIFTLFAYQVVPPVVIQQDGNDDSHLANDPLHALLVSSFQSLGHRIIRPLFAKQRNPENRKEEERVLRQLRETISESVFLHCKGLGRRVSPAELLLVCESMNSASDVAPSTEVVTPPTGGTVGVFGPDGTNLCAVLLQYGHTASGKLIHSVERLRMLDQLPGVAVNPGGSLCLQRLIDCCVVVDTLNPPKPAAETQSGAQLATFGALGKLTSRLLPCITLLATNLHGSYVVQHLYNQSTHISIRQAIVAKLATSLAQLRQDFVGRKLIQHFNVELYSKRPKDWANVVAQHANVKRLMAKILVQEDAAQMSARTKEKALNFKEKKRHPNPKAERPTTSATKKTSNPNSGAARRISEKTQRKKGGFGLLHSMPKAVSSQLPPRKNKNRSRQNTVRGTKPKKNE